MCGKIAFSIPEHTTMVSLGQSQMGLIKIILIAITLVGLTACKHVADKTAKPDLPRNLNEAIAYLDKDWNFIEKSKFKNQPEDAAVTSLHFSTGLWIRNNWIYGDRAPNLVKYFHKIGIFAPDDISSIILTSFHRQLNHKSLDSNGQVKPYILNWKSITDCEEATKKSALINYNKFAVGNSITILMVVDTSESQRSATVYECLNVDWKFDRKKDLMINGVVTEKYFKNDSSNVFFKVRIKKMNYPNTTIFSDTVKVGDIENFSLKHLIVK